jgi:hypothetical protein
VERVVAGRLLDELGQPWSGWVVTARAGGRPAGRTRTDALGRFELTVATDEPLDVLASNGAEQRSARGVLPPRVGVEVVLPRAGTVRLEVVDRVTGDRVRGFDIHRRASARSGPFLRNPAPEPDSSGLVRWTVPTGTWDVAVDARSQGYALGTASCVRVEPWGEVALRVELDRGTTLAVDVVGLPHGVGLNMWLVPVEEGARGSGIATSGWGRLLQEEVGFDGERHVVRGVVPGRYRLSAFDRIEATGITLHGQPEVTVAARYLPPSPLTPEQEAFLRRVYEQGLFCPDD